jgi:hypothetical protein
LPIIAAALCMKSRGLLTNKSGGEGRRPKKRVAGVYDDAWARHASSLPTGMAFRRRLKQTGVEPQSCDETDMAANRGDQIEGREAGVCDPAALDRVIQPDYDWSDGQEPVEDHRQQRAVDGATVPSCPVEHIMIEREVTGPTEAHDTQGGAHRALAGREHHAGDER